MKLLIFNSTIKSIFGAAIFFANKTISRHSIFKLFIPVQIPGRHSKHR